MNMYAIMIDKAFKEADKDKSGEIDKHELKGVLNSVAKDLNLEEITEDEVKLYLNKLDIDKNEKVDQKEFGKLFQEIIEAKKNKLKK